MIANERAEKLAGIRELADWLETHPEVPMPSFYEVNAFPKHSSGQMMGNAEAIAELRRLGGLLGVAPHQSGPHVALSGPKFSGGVKYAAVVCNVQLDHFANDACRCCGRPNDITQGEGEVGASSAVEAPTAPGDGHVYACCGKLGRISRHNAWCETGQALGGAA